MNPPVLTPGKNGKLTRAILAIFILGIPGIFAVATLLKPKPKPPRHSFCYWATRAKLFPEDLRKMDSLGVDHLYLRYFDVDWSPSYGGAVPKGEMEGYSEELNLPATFTPAVFFTNAVFEKTPEEKIPGLAGKVAAACNRMDREIEKHMNSQLKSEFTKRRNEATGEKYNWNVPHSAEDSLRQAAKRKFENACTEILIDCDWTAGTRAKFFQFINELRDRMPGRKIVCTLRLWQYKDRNTSGVPPADKALLMCYGLGGPNLYERSGNISSAAGIEPFLKGVGKYPLPLDIALPLYCWRSLFREGQFKGMISDDDQQVVEGDTATWKMLGPGHYGLKRDLVIGDLYARYGDELKVESVSGEEINKIIGLLKTHVPLDDNSRVTLFSFTDENINRYGMDRIKKFYEAFN